MANDRKWTYLAELAKMRVDWAHIVDDIVEAVNKTNLVNESQEESKDEESAEEQFDLNQILDLNQIKFRQAQDLENIYLNEIRE